MPYAFGLALRQSQRSLYTRKPIRHGYSAAKLHPHALEQQHNDRMIASRPCLPYGNFMITNILRLYYNLIPLHELTGKDESIIGVVLLAQRRKCLITEGASPTHC